MQPELLQQLVNDLLRLLGVTVESTTVTTGHRTVVAVSTPDTEALIGPGGEHLRALNTIAHRLVEKKYGAPSAAFLIDVNGHHEKQMETVRGNARMLAQRVRLFKHDIEMSPMSAYERLVVHELFSDDPEIETTSQGEGKFRHIVLKFRGGVSSAGALPTDSALLS